MRRSACQVRSAALRSTSSSARWSTWSSSSPRPNRGSCAGSGSAAASPRSLTGSTAPPPSRRPPTPPSSSSATAWSGRAKVAIASRWIFPVSRTSWCVGSRPRIRTRWSWSTRVRRSRWTGSTTSPRWCRRCSEARRWRTRSSTSSWGTRNRAAASRSPSRSDSSTAPHSAVSPARTAITATARGCSWDTGGTTRATCRCGSRSGTASRTRRLRSVPRGHPSASRAVSRS